VSSNKQANDRVSTSADFDGHLERPPEQQTFAERVQLAWEGTLMLHQLRREQASSETKPSRSDQTSA
jgi:hypothetical protein